MAIYATSTVQNSNGTLRRFERAGEWRVIDRNGLCRRAVNAPLGLPLWAYRVGLTALGLPLWAYRFGLTALG